MLKEQCLVLKMRSEASWSQPEETLWYRCDKFVCASYVVYD